ncbi:MAG: glutamine synthetase, partial [Methanosarcinaceae archaeon]|nr:glutamine synthetase [Methanosarcinaceae archaeon]
LDHLPASCWESAEALMAQKAIFMQYDVFTEGMLEGIAAELKAFDDYQLSEKLYGKNEEIKALVDKYIHCA